jgi:hypothetical protein
VILFRESGECPPLLRTLASVVDRRLHHQLGELLDLEARLTNLEQTFQAKEELSHLEYDLLEGPQLLGLDVGRRFGVHD